MAQKKLTDDDIRKLSTDELADLIDRYRESMEFFRNQMSQMMTIANHYNSEIHKIIKVHFGDTKDFEQFFGECFVKDPAAGPLRAVEVRSIFRDWKRGLGRNCNLKENMMFNLMKFKCGCGSSDREFWGVRDVLPTSS
jgi:hypothetical protein